MLMEELSLEMINNIVNSPSVYLVMFMFLLRFVLKTSQDRESKMREQLDRIVPILDNLVRDVTDIKNELKER